MPTTTANLPAYPAHAFHASLPDGRAPGELTLNDVGLHFESATHAVTLPFDGAQLTLGGAGNRLVFIAHPAQPQWSIYTSERAILNDPRVLQHPGMVQAVRQIRRQRLWGVGITLALLVLLLSLPVVLLLNVGLLTRTAARQVPLEWEEQLGKLAFARVQWQTQMLEDAQASQLLERLTQQLTAAVPDARYQFHFYIARDASLNAFALPGGYVVVNSGLLLRATSAEELLGVLAHEISHVTERHGMRNLITSAGLLLTIQLLIGDAGGVLGTLASAAPYLLTQQYSRGFEREADRNGYLLLVRANIDPAGLLSFFAKLQAEEARLRTQTGEVGDLLGKIPEFMSTHPTTDSRITELRRQVGAHNGSYHDFGETFTTLKARVQAAGTASQEDLR